jgi:hypothetical protein
MKKLAYAASAVTASVLPVFALAQTEDIQGLGQTIIDLINGVFVPLIFALAFLVFLWGVFQYFIVGGADEEKREQGRSLMIWGLIGFFVMVSVWGLVNLLVNTIGLDNGGPTLPSGPDTGF